MTFLFFDIHNAFLASFWIFVQIRKFMGHSNLDPRTINWPESPCESSHDLISILQTFCSWAATSHLRPPMVFLSHNSSDTLGLAPLMNVLFWGRCNKLIGQGYVKERLRSSSEEVLWSVRGSYKIIWGPPRTNVTRHSGWSPFYSDTLHWSGISPIFDTTTDLDLNTKFDFLPNFERFP